MFIANDENGIRTGISEASVECEYFCPLCNGPLIQKRGKVKINHFAHKQGCECDSWHYDMSEWHREWQNHFPMECREVVIERDGKKHRADVLINNTVVEFQHSSLSREEFQERNQFYSEAGYKIVWLFDIQERVNQRNVFRLLSDDNDKYCWKWAPHVFDGYFPGESKIIVYWQLGPVSEADHGIKHLLGRGPSRERFWIEKNVAYNDKEFVSLIDGSFGVPQAESETKMDFRRKSYADIVLPRTAVEVTLYKLIKESTGNVIIVRNSKTGDKVKIEVSKIRGSVSADEVTGYFARDDKNFYNYLRPIYRAYKQEWVKEWEDI